VKGVAAGERYEPLRSATLIHDVWRRRHLGLVTVEFAAVNNVRNNSAELLRTHRPGALRRRRVAILSACRRFDCVVTAQYSSATGRSEIRA